LVFSRSVPLSMARAATSEKVAANKNMVRGYSPIGLTFDTCATGTKYVWLIAQSPETEPTAPNAPNYQYAGTIHHAQVQLTDKSGHVRYSASADSDLLIYVLDPDACGDRATRRRG
jgi:hypothetical protein